MIKKILLLIIVHITQTLFGQTFPDVIIKNVNIIPMNKDTVLINKSVAILDGKISDINDFIKIKKDSKTKILDAAGKYLLPGLTEMHIHLPSPQKLDTFLITLVSAGVTHVRAMYSDYPILKQRE